MRNNSKKKKRQVRRAKRKGIEAQKAKLTTPTRAADALIGDEEQTEKII